MYFVCSNLCIETTGDWQSKHGARSPRGSSWRIELTTGSGDLLAQHPGCSCFGGSFSVDPNGSQWIPMDSKGNKTQSPGIAKVYGLVYIYIHIYIYGIWKDYNWDGNGRLPDRTYDVTHVHGNLSSCRIKRQQKDTNREVNATIEIAKYLEVFRRVMVGVSTSLRLRWMSSECLKWPKWLFPSGRWMNLHPHHSAYLFGTAPSDQVQRNVMVALHQRCETTCVFSIYSVPYTVPFQL